MKALRFERDLPRYAAARLAGSVIAGKGATAGPLQLTKADTPSLPGPDWVTVRPRLAGICGSDLATVDGKSSRYFEPIVSFPFIPGHEIVADLDDDTRVVVIPVLNCAIRGISPACAACTSGATNHCERVAFGHLEPGLQTGYCTDTGGGWSTRMVAHRSQLIEVPSAMSDEAAVMVEPTACAVHAAAMASQHRPSSITIIGAGTLGLLTLAALRGRGVEATIVATAKYPEQRRFATALGADRVVAPGELVRTIRAQTGSFVLGGKQLTGGTEVVVDCVGSTESLTQSLSIVAPGGTIVMVGMPGPVEVDLTPLWHRETVLRGCYAYTNEDFVTAIDVVQSADLGRLLSATYPLARYREAIDHAASAGRRGAVKVAFDLRDEKERTR